MPIYAYTETLREYFTWYLIVRLIGLYITIVTLAIIVNNSRGDDAAETSVKSAFLWVGTIMLLGKMSAWAAVIPVLLVLSSWYRSSSWYESRKRRRESDRKEGQRQADINRELAKLQSLDLDGICEYIKHEIEAKSTYYTVVAIHAHAVLANRLAHQSGGIGMEHLAVIHRVLGGTRHEHCKYFLDAVDHSGGVGAITGILVPILSEGSWSKKEMAAHVLERLGWTPECDAHRAVFSLARDCSYQNCLKTLPAPIVVDLLIQICEQASYASDRDKEALLLASFLGHPAVESHPKRNAIMTVFVQNPCILLVDKKILNSLVSRCQSGELGANSVIAGILSAMATHIHNNYTNGTHSYKTTASNNGRLAYVIGQDVCVSGTHPTKFAGFDLIKHFALAPACATAMRTLVQLSTLLTSIGPEPPSPPLPSHYALAEWMHNLDPVLFARVQPLLDQNSYANDQRRSGRSWCDRCHAWRTTVRRSGQEVHRMGYGEPDWCMTTYYDDCNVCGHNLYKRTET
jgi:hypothetical protein